MRVGNVLKIIGIAVGVLVVVVGGIGAGIYYFAMREGDPFTPLYAENCAVCHGEAFEGGAQGPALVGRELVHGESVAELSRSISLGYPEKGMPGWAGPMNDGQIRSLAILIGEQRVNRKFTDFKTDQVLAIPTEPIESRLATFRIETVVQGMATKPFSIAPLPDGSILVTEKIEGLSIVSPNGKREPVVGTPETTGFGLTVRGLDLGLGWLLDVKPHPDYEHNGWIYLVHTDLCADCGKDGDTFVPTTMIRLVRGRIRNLQWIDEEVIWSVPETFYTSTPDIAAGGRLTFDTNGHVYVSVGAKGADIYIGIQDLSTPYGKVHRVYDDGRMPEDNPFANRADAMPSIWTYGHRSPQGLEFDPNTGTLWETEMGPRGGDEVNELRPGKNYGWPLYSKGVDYDGTPVEYWKDLGLEFDLSDIEQPVVDLTPSPAVSSFVIYEGDAFPQWQHQLIVGSLKATELYRFAVDDRDHVESEILLKDLARIRDIEIGAGGVILLLLEHGSGSRIVRLVPALVNA